MSLGSALLSSAPLHSTPLHSNLLCFAQHCSVYKLVFKLIVNVRELLRRLRIETYLKDARANRKETNVW